MSTTDHSPRASSDEIDVIADEEHGTVTFVADYPDDGLLAPTEWITVDSETLVDTRDYR